MMKNYMTTGTFAKGKKPEGGPVGKAATPFLEEKAVMSICSGPTPPPPTSPGISSNLGSERLTL
jgi:hypothetical protein